MIGVTVLLVVVGVAVVGAVALAVRDAGRRARARRAEADLRAALTAPSEDARRIALDGLSRTVARAPAAEAAALVLACRRAFSREVVPVLAAAVGHTDPGVAQDAARALADVGAPGLRAAWRARLASAQPPAALRAFLLAHPDWLFERLLEDFVASGQASVRRHEDLWRESGPIARLRLMRDSDAIGAMRAHEIGRLLGVDVDGGQPGAGARPKAG